MPRAEVAMQEDDYLINLHIPSNGGPLTPESVEASLSEAYDELVTKRGLFKNGVMKVVCHSWLLYPPTRTFISDESNLAQFIDRFMIAAVDDHEGFHDGWRLFGKAWGSDEFKSLPDYSHLPEDTSLRRGYKNLLMQGGRGGFGFGILLFTKKS